MEITLKLPFQFKRGEDAPVIGDQNQLVADQAHGKYYNLVKGGRVFSQATTPLGLALPIYTATGITTVVLWNPPDSGVNVIPLTASCAYASGTAVYGAIGLMVHDKDILNGLATAGYATAFAETTPINAIVGGGQASKIRSSNAGTNTFTAGVAADFKRSMFSTGALAATTAVPVVNAVYDFDGSIILKPGTIAWLAQQLASSALYAVTIVWCEEDV